MFREALELLLGLRADIEVVASVGDGPQAVAACREHQPDVVLMDYRLPGLDGVQATAAVREACPEIARRLPDRVVASARGGRAPRGGRGRVPLEGPGARRDRRRDPRGRRAHQARGLMELDRREHGDRPRLDRRLPRGARALPELARRPALRPLRRRELPRLRRPRPGRVLRAAAHRRRSCRRPRSRRRGDFLDVYEELRRLRADLLAAHLGEALRHLRRARSSRRSSSRATGCA